MTYVLAYNREDLLPINCQTIQVIRLIIRSLQSQRKNMQNYMVYGNSTNTIQHIVKLTIQLHYNILFRTIHCMVYEVLTI